MIGQSAGKSFAYILGVYLGDGCVTTWRCKGKSDRLAFRLNTIDQDFAQAVKAALENMSERTVTIGSHAVKKSTKPNWYICLHDREICERLVRETNKKMEIPCYVYSWPNDHKLAFIAGLMDSEGHVSINSRGSIYIGFRNTANWFMEAVRVFQSVGLVVGKLGKEILPSGKQYHRVSFKLASWLKSGAFFNIARKQERVDKWHAAKLTSETIRQTP